uniref:Uncharacterized protein n=1 Tax=Lygus hesperus TaxID=30085 RepID=A0A0A9YPX5_LYGHE
MGAGSIEVCAFNSQPVSPPPLVFRCAFVPPLYDPAPLLFRCCTSIIIDDPVSVELKNPPTRGVGGDLRFVEFIVFPPSYSVLLFVVRLQPPTPVPAVLFATVFLPLFVVRIKFGSGNSVSVWQGLYIALRCAVCFPTHAPSPLAPYYMFLFHGFVCIVSPTPFTALPPMLVPLLLTPPFCYGLVLVGMDAGDELYGDCSVWLTLLRWYPIPPPTSSCGDVPCPYGGDGGGSVTGRELVAATPSRVGMLLL